MADCLTLLRLLNICIFRRGVEYHGNWEGEGAKHLSSLPVEIWLHIVSFLDPWSSLVCLGCTSIEFRCIALQHFYSGEIKELFFIKGRCNERKYQDISKSLVVIHEFIEQPKTKIGALAATSFLHTYGSLSKDKVINLLNDVSLQDQNLFIDCRYAIIPERFITKSFNTLGITRGRHGIKAMLYFVKNKFKELNIDIQIHDIWKYMAQLGKKSFLREEEKRRTKKSKITSRSEFNKRKLNAASSNKYESQRLVKKICMPRPLETDSIVSHEKIGCNIDIDGFCHENFQSGKVEYDPAKFVAAIVKDTPGTAIVFKTGTIIYTGHKNMEMIEVARQTVHEMIQPFIINSQ